MKSFALPAALALTAALALAAHATTALATASAAALAAALALAAAALAAAAARSTTVFAEVILNHRVCEPSSRDWQRNCRGVGRKLAHCGR